MIATSHPLAASTGIRVLQDGGNAVDAAIAVAAVLAVVEPTMTGIGGDMFALLFMKTDGRAVGVNGSGWAGSLAQTGEVRGPELSAAQTVTVPGAVRGWFSLHERYATFPMSRLLAPAIGYAEQGFPVSEIVAAQWTRAVELAGEAAPQLGVFLPGGRAPVHGELFRNPDLARTLAALADVGAGAFYSGTIRDAIVRSTRSLGGFLTEADFEEFEVEWVEPLSVGYRDCQVFELPPNTQGVTALEMLRIVEAWDLASLGHNSADYVHRIVEAKKEAFRDRNAAVADPRFAPDPSSRILSTENIAEIRRRIDPTRAGPSPMSRGGSGDTVCFSAVDRDGNVVSFINSLFEYFGCGVVVPGTGVCLHNRGRGFSLDPRDPNGLAPRKRPLHTLIPGLVMKDHHPWLSFGLMGGEMQAQGHVQVLLNLIDFGMNVQEAGDAARFRHDPEGVALESAFGSEIRESLRNRGHHIRTLPGGFGGYQAIMIDHESGTLAGGSDHRKDGQAVGY